MDRLAHAGPVPFAAYMSAALYHPRHGYYAGGRRRTGWHGDFVTSAELDPAFGELWCRGFEDIWQRCGRPAEFWVVEVGPGEGGFAEAVLAAARGNFAAALMYRCIERIPELERRQRQRLACLGNVSWSTSLEETDAVEAGCLFANEVLDNLPVHVVEGRKGRLFELCVEAHEGRLIQSLRPLSSPEIEGYLERAQLTVKDGHQVEIGLAAESFVKRAAGLLRRGALVFVDYGMTSAEVAARPQGTLVSYSDAGVDDAVLERPGEKDITAHVNWTAVAAACRAAGMDVGPLTAQRAVLRGLGLGAIDRRLRGEYGTAVGEGRGADAVRALSRRQGLRALADASGLGGLQVFVATRGLHDASFLDDLECIDN